jgi:hypothetical protein
LKTFDDVLSPSSQDITQMTKKTFMEKMPENQPQAIACLPDIEPFGQPP